MKKVSATAIAGLALAFAGAPPHAHAAPPQLKWPPPPLVNPVTVTVAPGNFAHWCQHNEDVKLVWPAGKHVGSVTIAACHNVVSIAGWTTVPATADTSNSAPSRAFYVDQDTGTVHIEGLLVDSSGGAMEDVIDINAPLATVQIENVRAERIYGFNDQFHADCVQPFGGVKALRIYSFTCRTAYQGLSIGPMPGTPPGWTADIENTNIVLVDAPIYGAHNNGGYLFWPCADSACAGLARTVLSQVWLQPRPGQPPASTVWAGGFVSVNSQFAHPYINFAALPIDGHVTVGTPPGGDFVPVGVAGLGYVSPGYAAP